MKRASLTQIRQQQETGKLYHDPNAPTGVDLDANFWEHAKLAEPKRSRSVHLRLDAEVFEYFFAATGGKGHLSRMQAVLKAYAAAHRIES